MTTPTGISRPMVQAVLDGVDAYIQQFRPPLAPPFLRPVFAAVLSALKEDLTPEQGTAVIQAALEEFNPLVALQKTPKAGAMAIATQVEQHLKPLNPGMEVRQVLDVVEAYLQKTHAPRCRSFLYPIVLAIIPQLSFFKGTENQAIQLANQVMLTFDPDRVATKVGEATLGAIATQLIPKIPSFQPEQAILGIGRGSEVSLRSSMDPAEMVLYQLAKAFLAQMTDLPHPGKPLDGFVWHVSVRFGSRRTGSKSSKQLANELSVLLTQEIDRFRTLRNQTLIPADATQPTVFGDLQIGITLKKPPAL